MKNNYIIISSIDWKTSWQTQHRLAKSLVNSGNRVLFIENTGIRNIQIKDKSRIFSRFKTWKNSTNGFDEVEKNLFVYSPIIFPAPYNKIISYYNAKKIFKNVSKWMDVVYFDSPVVICFLPTILNNHLLDLLKPNLYIYYAANDFGTQKGTEKILKSEISTIKRANLNFATSHQIVDKINKYSKQTYFFPASIEEKKFKNIKGNKPNIFEKMTQPIIGYLGNFTDVFDIDLMSNVIKNSPKFNFLFIGDLKFYNTKSIKLKSFKNCYFTGELNNDLVPLYLKHIDIGIIPYLVNQFTNGVYSSKLNEYLALGLPVITTKFNEMNLIKNKNKNLIYLSDNDYIDFKEQIKKSLADKEKFKKIRIEYAFNNSWDKKFIEIERIINNALLNVGFISQDWKKNYLRIIKNYSIRLMSLCIILYITIFTLPTINFLGSKLHIQDTHSSSGQIILVMSGYGSDDYYNNSYLLIAKRTRELLKEMSSSNEVKIIISGRFQIYPESQLVKKILTSEGINERKIITINSDYKNTYENLNLFFETAKKNNLDINSEVTLITSPLHSKRVSLIIKKKFPKYKINIITSQEQKISKISKLKIVIYEYSSIIYNYFKGNL